MRTYLYLKQTCAIVAGFLTLNLQTYSSERDSTLLDPFKRVVAIKEGTLIQDPKIIGHIVGYAYECPPYTVSSSNLFTIKKKNKQSQEYTKILAPYERILQPILEAYGNEVCLIPLHSLERYTAKGREDLAEITGYWKDFIRSYPTTLMITKGTGITNPTIITHIIDYIHETHLPHNMEKLIGEINYHLSAKELSAQWLEGVLLRFAALCSDPSPEERDVFSQTYPAEYAALLDKSSLSSHLLMNASFDDHFHKHHGKTFNVHRMLSYKELQLPSIYQAPRLIKQHLHPYIKAPFPCYFPGTKIGVEDMMRLWLNDIYPIGFPKAEDRGSAHGVEFSPLGFLMHDKFHLEDGFYRKQAALINFMLKQIDHYVKDSNYWDLGSFVEAFAPRAVERYYIVSRVLETLLNQVKSKDSKNFKPFVAGMFLATHEHNGFDASIFSGWGHSTPSGDIIGKHIVRTLATKVRKHLQSPKAWENPADPFHTSPVTGHSLLTDKQIAEITTTAKARKLQDYPDAEPKKSSVERSNRFITVTIPHKNMADPIKYSRATLYHKLLNASDSLALLNYAGVKFTPDGSPIAKPQQEDREAVTRYLDVIHKQLCGLVDAFERIGVSYSDHLGS